MDSAEFLRQFENCDLPKVAFTHEKHIFMAWLYLNDTPLPEALIKIRDGILKFAGHYGLPGLYHETITFWYALAIHDRLKTQGPQNFENFKNQNPDLFDSKKFISSYYTEDMISSAAAKATFVLPALL